MRLSLRLYRLLIKLYPAGFRESYEGPLQRDFKDEYALARNRRDVARLWGRTLSDFARSMPGQLAAELGQDARHAMRVWRQRPLPTLFAVAVLAIAIGANTGVFSVLNALVLRSLPFRDPERLVWFHNFTPPGSNQSATEFHEWRRASRYLDDAAAFVVSDVTLDGSPGATRVRLTETSWNFFTLLGAQPAPGRGFVDGEDVPGHTGVAVIGHGLWVQRFGGNPRAVGTTIRLNGVPFTVIGVAPPGFDYPEAAEVWTPTTVDWQRIAKTGVVFWSAIARLRSGLTWAEARQAFEAEAHARQPAERMADPINRPALSLLQTELAGPARQASLLLMGGVGVLLLLACANVANLLLSRTVARSTELMIRSVLGASRARLAQQLVTETVLLSGVAAIAGLIVARWTAGVAAAAQPPELSAQVYSVLDWRVLGFAAALAFATGIVFGVAPALYVSRTGVVLPSRTTTAAPRRTRVRQTLVAVQIGLTIVLLTGSLALGRAFLALLKVDNGYEVRSLATMSVSFAGTPYADADRIQPYYATAVERLRHLPGVVAASATESLPLNIRGFMAARFKLDEDGSQSPLATVTLVAPGFFEAVGGHVVAGREYADRDLKTDERLAVVNEELARSLGGTTTVVGRLMTADTGKPRRIIGVVRGLRYAGPAWAVRPQAFYLSKSPGTLTFVVRVAGDARDRLAMIRDALQSVDPALALFSVKTMQDRLDEALARPRFYAIAIVFFGGLALLIAVIGVYGVVSYGVQQRLREMGIRLALGTTAGRLRALLFGQTARIVAVGAVPGLLLAIAAGRSATSLVAGADAALVATSIAAALVTAGVAAAAIWSATRRVTRLDILEVIRSDAGD